MKTVSRISLSETIDSKPYQDILGKRESKPYTLLAIPIHLVSRYGLQPHLPSCIRTRLRRVVDCLWLYINIFNIQCIHLVDFFVYNSLIFLLCYLNKCILIVFVSNMSFFKQKIVPNLSVYSVDYWKLKSRSGWLF